MFDYGPTLEPGVDEYVGQTDLVAQKEGTFHGALDLLQEGVHVLDVIFNDLNLLHFGLVEEGDEFVVVLADPDAHFHLFEGILGN